MTLFPLCPQLMARKEIVFTILSLQSTEVPTIYLKSKGFNILRWGVGPGKVGDFTLVIYLTLTGELSPKELNVMGLKGPGRKQAIVNSG